MFWSAHAPNFRDAHYEITDTVNGTRTVFSDRSGHISTSFPKDSRRETAPMRHLLCTPGSWAEDAHRSFCREIRPRRAIACGSRISTKQPHEPRTSKASAKSLGGCRVPFGHNGDSRRRLGKATLSNRRHEPLQEAANYRVMDSGKCSHWQQPLWLIFEQID